MSQQERKYLHIQSRTDTKQNWEDINPILLEREIGYEKDTGQYKFGDGNSLWTDLPYAHNIENGEGQFSLQQLSSQAKGAYSHAEGYQTMAISKYSSVKGSRAIAGCKGYWYSSVELNNDGTTTIKLTTIHDKHRTEEWSESDKCGYQPDDIISIIADSKYYNCATIKSVNNNVIVVKEDLFDKLTNYKFTFDGGFDGNIVFVLSKPDIGYVDLGIAATSEGGSVKDNEITAALGPFSHVEGRDNQAIGHYSHAEGRKNKASNVCAHVEGQNSIAQGMVSHAEGSYAEAIGKYSHAEGNYTTASGAASHAEGNDTEANGVGSHAEGWITHATNIGSHSEGRDTWARGEYSHAEGYNNQANEKAAHAEGEGNTASGLRSHAEGENTTASGTSSHAEGGSTTASGYYSHAEGDNTKASGYSSHAEGAYTEAIGNKSHAEGNSTIASGATSHAEGNDTKASGTGSHAEGWLTIASGEYSHSEGLQTTASGKYSHVQGKYNIVDEENKYAHIVGNGKENGNKITLSNAHTLDWEGNAWYAGNILSQAPDSNLNCALSAPMYVGNFHMDWNASDILNNVWPIINLSLYDQYSEAVIEKTGTVGEIFNSNLFNITVGWDDNSINQHFESIAEAGIQILSDGQIYIFNREVEDVDFWEQTLGVNITIYYTGGGAINVSNE